MQSTNLLPILFILYFIQGIIHIILCYKIMKHEKIISGLMDFMISGSSGYILLLQIFLGKRKNNLFITNLFRINFIIAIIIFISMLFIIIP